MAEDEKKPDKDDLVPLTKQEFVDALDKLVKRGREAGLRPIQVMAGTYVKKFFDVVDGVLSGLDDGKSKEAPSTEDGSKEDDAKGKKPKK